jgi:FtsP/CotA-like multicopper oxidase with cupredoxin domain
VAPRTVEIALDEFDFAPDSLTFESGRPYRVMFRNVGTGFTSSEFFSAVLLRPEAPGTSDARTGQIELGSGASTVVEFVPVATGRYSFHCTHGMHELFGMSGEAEIH